MLSQITLVAPAPPPLTTPPATGISNSVTTTASPEAAEMAPSTNSTSRSQIQSLAPTPR
ncbi:hypothetical protein LINPERPRIM_LOCUS29504 [Linum perenne]